MLSLTVAAAAAAALCASGVAADGLTAAQRASVLAEHNSERAAYGVPALTYSTALETQASGYADQCTWAHSPSSARPGAGENLNAWTLRAPADFAAGVASWNDERQFYSCASGACASGRVCGTRTPCPSETGASGGAGYLPD